MLAEAQSTNSCQRARLGALLARCSSFSELIFVARLFRGCFVLSSLTPAVGFPSAWRVPRLGVSLYRHCIHKRCTYVYIYIYIYTYIYIYIPLGLACPSLGRGMGEISEIDCTTTNNNNNDDKDKKILMMRVIVFYYYYYYEYHCHSS